MSQEIWLRLIVGENNKNLTCVGDEDQMIYGFRGANGCFIREFDQIYSDAKVISLEQNYRSTKLLLSGANNLISMNKNRRPKTLWTENADGAPIEWTEYKNVEEEVQAVVD